MAAGQGFKTFTTGEVLTAGDVNGYLMQGINVFTNATARDAAITAPAEGQFAFTKDNNSLWYYDGAAWVASGATGDIEGVTAGVGISGGGTSGTVTITNSMATAIDAKGDLVAGTGADTFARLAVGTNGQVLKANSATATGLEWGAASAAKSYTLLGTGTTTSGSTVTVSGISGIDDIYVFFNNVSITSASQPLNVRLNADTANHYTFYGYITAGSTYSAANFDRQIQSNVGTIEVATMGNTAGSVMAGYIRISGCNSTNSKMFHYAGNGSADTTGQKFEVGGGYYAGTSAISSISLVTASGTFDNGSFLVYGAA